MDFKTPLMGRNQPFEKTALNYRTGRGLKGHLGQSLYFIGSKLRLREVKSLVQGHTASKWQCLDLNQDLAQLFNSYHMSAIVLFFKCLISFNTHCDPMKHIIIPTLQTRKGSLRMEKTSVIPSVADPGLVFRSGRP